MIVINLFAGPGAGKSTTASHLFALMKHRGINVELVTEYAKELTWRNDRTALNDALFVAATQAHRQFILEDHVDYCITDSPILTSSMYAYGRFSTPWFHSTVASLFRSYNNTNFILKRYNRPYQRIGRNQTEVEARAKDLQIENMLTHLGERTTQVRSDEFAAQYILNMIGV